MGMNNSSAQKLSKANDLWSLREFQHADFGDTRLNARASAIASDLLSNPGHSIPKALSSWDKVKGAYRFFDNENVTDENVLNAHILKTVERCATEKTILVAQDTTTLSFKNRQMEGLGKVGDGRCTGCFTHSGLALTTTGIPLGIVYQKTYVRKEKFPLPDKKGSHKQVDIKDKESFRWVECIEKVKAALPTVNTVIIGDRESDIYDVFHQAELAKTDVLIRTSWNRLLEKNSGTNTTYLFDKADAAEIIANYSIEVPKTKNSHTTRSALITIRKCNFTLKPPKHRVNEALPDINLSLIDVREDTPVTGEDPIHWMLSTTLTVNTKEECIEKVKWYVQRWKVERFHYVLKTGVFDVEKLQFKTVDRLAKVLTMFSVLACRILFLMYMERNNPTLPATDFLTEKECLALKKLNGINLDVDISIAQAIIFVAKLGGYLNRKSDLPPGVKILWRGFSGLSFVLVGMDLA